MTFKRFFALFLCVLMLFSAVACSTPSGGEDDTSGQSAATTSPQGTSIPEETGPKLDEWGREWVDDDVPELNFSGETLKFLARKDTSGYNRWSIDFYADSSAATVMEEAVFKRNEKVAERLLIQYEITIEDGSWDNFNIYATRIENSYQTGDHMFDVVGTYSLYGAQFATRGYFYNVLELDSQHHLNLDKVWWNQRLREDLTINNMLFMLVGDMNTTALTRMMCVFFNPTTVKNKYNGIDLYEVVNNGDWTMDYLIEMISESYFDTNGDSVANADDFYGLVSAAPSESYDSIGAGMDIKMMERKTDGSWAFTANTELLVNKLQKCVDLYWSGNNSTILYDNLEETYDHFANSRAHFLVGTLDKAMEATLGNMSDDYGVLPMPKYNKEQAMYYTAPQDAYNMISVMGDVQNPAMVSAALELLCAESYKNVTPELFNVVLKMRYMRDYASGQMLDYLREGIVLDFATVNTLSLGDCGRWFRNTMSGSKANAANVAASTLKTSSKVWERSLVKFLSDYEKLGK